MANHQSLTYQFQKDEEYYEAHCSEILAQYPEQWVAILNESVVGASDDAFELIAKLRAEGVPTQRTVLRHATAKPEILILPVL